MKQEYTFRILKYLYKELSITDHLETDYAISNDKEWKSEYVLLNRAYKMLPKVTFYPKKSIVNNVLAYSSGTAA